MIIFTPNTVIKSTEINSNFAELKDGTGIDNGAIASNKLANTIGCSVYRAGTQSIASTTFTVVVFDTEVFDSGGDYNTSTGEFTCPVAGKYLITFHAMIENLTAGSIQYLYINQDNGTPTTLIGSKDRITATNLERSATLVTTTYAEAGDKLYARLYHDYGSNRDLLGSQRWNGFTVTYLGA